MNFAAPINAPDALWISSDRHCMWDSVTCEKRSVTKLNLNGRNLAGTIASEIKLLSNLVEFDISDNYLTGSITSDIFSLSALTRLM